MSKFSLYYPARPYFETQKWGVYDPKTYHQFGYDRHNGNDIAKGTDNHLNAPFDYTIVRTGNQPEGGGIFFGMMSDVYDWPDGKYRVLLDMLHCETLLCKEGQIGKAGDLLAIADNTGFSTGPHTHLQARRVLSWNGKTGTDLNWTQADHNDANGSFDLVPYWNGNYAADATKVIMNLTKQVSILQAIVNLLTTFLKK